MTGFIVDEQYSASLAVARLAQLGGHQRSFRFDQNAAATLKSAGEPKAAAAARRAISACLTAHQARQTFGDRKAQAGTGVISRRGYAKRMICPRNRVLGALILETFPFGSLVWSF